MTKHIQAKSIIRKVKVIAALSLLLLIGAFTVSFEPSLVFASSWSVGDVFVARAGETFSGGGTGYYRVFDNSGNPKEYISFAEGGHGCAFDLDSNLYTTTVNDATLPSRVIKHSKEHPHDAIQTIDTRVNGQNAEPNDIVVAANGDFYVTVAHTSGIQRYNAAGIRQQSYPFGSIPLWMDLASDQAWIFYTLGIPGSGQITKYNVVTGQSDLFANIGDNAYDVRLLPPGDGTAGLLVAHGVDIKRLYGNGGERWTYDVTNPGNVDGWTALDLDPNGTSFWAATNSGLAYRFNIDTGAVEVGPLDANFDNPTAGICVKQTDAPPPTNTPTPTPIACEQYQFATSTGTIVPGTTDIGSHCDDCTVGIALPFPYTLYDGTPFTSANISSNGNIQFVSANASYANVCLPTTTLDFAILPYWDDLSTIGPGPTSGVYTSVSGTAPNRIFNIEWRATLVAGGTSINFEARLYEGQTKFDIIYGAGTNVGNSATVGVQKDTGSRYTLYECNNGGPAPGVMLTFTLPPCATATPTNTSTPTATPTRTEPGSHYCGSAMPTITAGVPVSTTSYYVYEVGPSQDDLFYNDGWVQGRKSRDVGPSSGIVILNFGQPWDNIEEASISISGTLLTDNLDFAEIADIEQAAKKFADGFYEGSHIPPSPDPPRLTLALGVTNFFWWTETSSNPTNFGTHGRLWGEMVLRVAEHAKEYHNVTVDAAIDIEFPWNSAGRTRLWTDDYSQAVQRTGHRYYNFGSCDGCYPIPNDPRQPNVDPPYSGTGSRKWYLDDIHYLSVFRAARPLTQIFYPVRNSPNPNAPEGEQSCQWENISRWEIDRGQGPIDFPGILTGWQSSPVSSHTLTAEAAWIEFRRALNSNPNPQKRTPMNGSWLTDLTKQGHAPLP